MYVQQTVLLMVVVLLAVMQLWRCHAAPAASQHVSPGCQLWRCHAAAAAQYVSPGCLGMHSHVMGLMAVDRDHSAAP